MRSADQGTRRTLLTGIAIGIGIGAFAAVAVGGNPGERMHRLLLVLVALAVICAVSAVYIRRNPVSPRSAKWGVASPSSPTRTGAGELVR